MNDFTLAQLNQIKENILYMRASTNMMNLEEPFLAKIESMIAHYCEHKTRVATSDEDGHMLVMCGHCDVILWHEKN